ncbi:hybrid non-ribosomal peptide synthetase/type I polyketide synthase [Paenibacillus oleatilyticus]|uniref:Amino acid adenylation domain-containing protein n=1 Tax=Paenibacillus oleatilyticus TaxID=2594886 RepID=A0ABV4VA47_9BACL
MDTKSKISRDRIEDILALTPMQEGLLYHYRKNMQSSQYCEHLVLHLEGNIDLKRFTSAWKRVQVSNEALRSVFRWEELNSPVQVILKNMPLPIQYEDYSHLSHQKALDQADEMSRLIFSGSIPIETEPFRIVFIRLMNSSAMMIFSYHHILLDGWSLGQIIHEWVTAYDCYSNSEEEKPKLKTFVKWLKQNNKETQRLFWTTYLKGIDSKATLPGCPYEPPETSISVMKTRSVNWSMEETASILQFIRQHDVTLSACLFAAWGKLLQIYNDTDDVIIGTVVSGRKADVPGINSLVGVLSNTIPIRIRALRDETASEFVQRINKEYYELESFENTPFVDIRTYSEFNNRSMMFDSLIVVENYPLHQLLKKTAGKAINIVSVEFKEANHFPLTLTLLPFEQKLSGTFTYDSEIFPEDTIASIAELFQCILSKLVQNPHSRLLDINWLPDSEVHKLLNQFNHPCEHFPPYRTLPELLQQQAESYPERVAIVTVEGEISYASLEKTSNQIANSLKNLGLSPDSVVGVSLPRSIRLLSVILGILKAGCIYMPIDPRLPSDRVRYMCLNAQAKYVISDRPDLFNKQEVTVLSYEVLEQGEALPPDTFPQLDSLAYVVYTSGSTGRPKGVAVTHKALMNRLYWSQQKYPLTSRDTLLQKTSIGFDVSLWELFWWILAGARLSLLEPRQEGDPSAIINSIDKHEVTIIHFVPTMLGAFLDYVEQKPYEMAKLASLRRVFTSGESLKIRHAKHFKELLTDRQGTLLTNLYGPTEAAIEVTYYDVGDTSGMSSIPIGRPISNVNLLILDRHQKLQPIGAIGELYITGICLAEGYMNQPTLTQEAFIPHPLNGNQRIYKTGDRAAWLPDGNILYLGRNDYQLKIRGYRIEIMEIEEVLLAYPQIRNAVVVADSEQEEQTALHAFITSPYNLNIEEIKSFLRQRLPHYMLPSFLHQVPGIPLTSSGKADRKALLKQSRRQPVVPALINTQSTKERDIAEIWSQVLNRTDIAVNDNFFEIGGHSLSLLQVQLRIQKKFNYELSIENLFRLPTIRLLAEHLDRESNPEQLDKQLTHRIGVATRDDIAIIGMSGRFPGSANIIEFWDNLVHGVESIHFFRDEELIKAGVSEEEVKKPNYVKASGILQDADCFDASFFGISPIEAEMMDPQHRIFLECSWGALENAGYDPLTYEDRIGLFAGSSISSYLIHNVLPYARNRSLDEYSIMLSNDKDFMTTRVSHKLNLRGPSISIQTACSTSLVSVHLACQSLMQKECEMALAGGVSVQFPQIRGYLYQPEGIKSPDGHCRAFDDSAAGTVNGSGAGVVVLKRLSDAERDGDYIYAVIKGSAINNDGAKKLSYTAPGVDGQAEVILQAHINAGVSPDSISYVETHGTGTYLGDPVEIAALTKAYRTHTDQIGFCAIGSVKTNIGHLDAAAGIAGLIKTVSALHHKKIPPSLHFVTPNSKTDWSTSPFFVNDKLTDWKEMNVPRRAGVSSFGIGGTNAHLVLEEYNPPTKTTMAGQERIYKLIMLSGKTDHALMNNRQRLISYFREHPEANLADVAYTLHTGRTNFEYRQFWVSDSGKDLVQQLEFPGRGCRKAAEALRPVTFLLPGQGTEYLGMGHELYETEVHFKIHVDECARLLNPLLEKDIREFMFFGDSDLEEGKRDWKKTSYIQPALFTLEYSLAKLWMHWGIQPESLLGHSMGEITAACLSGVFTLKDALWLITERGKWMQQTQAGAMLAVELNVEQAPTLLETFDICLAAVNSSDQFVLSGNADKLEVVQQYLGRNGVKHRFLRTNRAFHSSMMDGILEDFLERVAQIDLKPPQIPFISNISGRWITDEEATNPKYWVQHIRETVQFAQGVSELAKEPRRVFLEVGPGNVLSSFLRSHTEISKEHEVLCSIPAGTNSGEARMLLRTLGLLWQGGMDVNWKAFYEGEERRRCPLPGNYLERTRYWIDEDKKRGSVKLSEAEMISINWITWKRSLPNQSRDLRNIDKSYLILHHSSRAGKMVARYMHDYGHKVLEVSNSDSLSQRKLLNWLNERVETVIVMDFRILTSQQDFERLDTDFGHIAQWLVSLNTDCSVFVITPNLYNVIGTERVSTVKAAFTAYLIERWQDTLRAKAHVIDLDWNEEHTERLVPLLVHETIREDGAPLVAFRGGRRWQCISEHFVIHHSDCIFPKEPKVYLHLGSEGNDDFLFRVFQEFEGVTLVYASNYGYRRDKVDYKNRDIRRILNEVLNDYRHLDGVIYTAEDINTLKTSYSDDKPNQEQSMSLTQLKQETDELRELLIHTPLDFGLILIGGDRHAFSTCSIYLKAFAAEMRLESPASWHCIYLEDSVRRLLQETGTSKIGRSKNPQSGEKVFKSICSILYNAEGADWVISVPESATTAQLCARQVAACRDVSSVQSKSPGYDRPPLQSDYVAPLNPVEICIANQWQELLRIEHIGTKDHFIELGGNSLIGLQLISRLQEIFQVDYKIEYLFTHPTISQTHQKLVELLGDEEILLMYVEAYNEALNP